VGGAPDLTYLDIEHVDPAQSLGHRARQGLHARGVIRKVAHTYRRGEEKG
jgi:hypothetical protein